MKTEMPKLDLGDFMLILLSGTMAGLRERLWLDGYLPAADLVADLVDITDDYLTRGPGDDEDADDS